MSITGGLVSVEDGHKNGGPQDYVPTRKVRVELSFDSEASLEPACALADEKVSELLGRADSPSRQTVVKTVEEPAKVANPTPAAVAPVVIPAQTVAGPIAATADASLEIPDFLNKSKRGSKASKGSAIIAADPTTTVAVSSPAPATSAPAPASAEITHADLYKATSQTAEATKNPGAVLELIKSHTADLPAEKQAVAHIPAEKRQQYLDGLALLRQMAGA